MYWLMGKDDARYLKLEQLHERRKQVVRLHRNKTPVMKSCSYAACRIQLSVACWPLRARRHERHQTRCLWWPCPRKL